MIGIYKITNKLTNKCYIGQSLCIERRFKEHINCVKDYPLYDDIAKYGINNFIFEVLEPCNEGDLNEKEKYWINFFDSYNNGYNQTIGGKGVSQYDYAYLVELYLQLHNSVKVAQQVGCHCHTVCNALKAYNITPNEKSPGVARPIKQIDPITLETIAIYENQSLAAQAVGCIQQNISLAVTGKTKTAAGYIWKYTDDNSEIKNISIPAITQHKNQKVQQLDNNGNVINEYNSVKEALIALNKSTKAGNIYAACKDSSKTAYGYKWRYIDIC